MPKEEAEGSRRGCTSNRSRKKFPRNWKTISNGRFRADKEERLIEKVIQILNKLGLPYAYHHFAEGEGPDPPFICYLCPSTDNFVADGQVYLDIDVVNIELYTDKKDLELEKKLQRLLTESGFVYEKNEVWVESEKLYEVVYEFECAA